MQKGSAIDKMSSRLAALFGIRRAIIGNVTTNYFGFAVGSLVTLFLTPFLVHRLNPTQYGLWILLQFILGYFQLLELGIMPAAVRYVSFHKAREEKEEIESIIGSAMLLLLLASVVALPAVALVAWLGPRMFDLPEGGELLFPRAMWLIGLAAVLAYFKRLLSSVFIGYQRYDLLNLCSSSTKVLEALATVFFVIRGYGILTLFLIMIGRTALEALVELALVRRLFGLKINIFRSRRDVVRKLTGYSLYAFLIDIAVGISHKIDGVVIGMFLPMAAITSYDIATKISGAVEKVTEPLIGTFFPLASELHTAARPEALRRLLFEGTRMSVLMITPAVLIIGRHGGDLIAWWTAPEFVAASLPVLHIFLGIVFVAVFDSTAARILLGTGKVRFDATVSLGSAAANLVLSLLLVKRLGLAGVALGTLIPAVIFNVLVSVPYTCKMTGTRLLPFYAKVFLPVAGIAGVSIAFMAFSKTMITNPFLSLAVNSSVVLAATGAVLAGIVTRRARGRR